MLPSDIISHIFDFNGVNNFKNLQIVNKEFDLNVKKQIKEHAYIKFSLIRNMPKEEQDTFKRILYDLDEPLVAYLLPKFTKSLSIFSNTFNHPIAPNVLPSSLIDLYLGHRFSQPLTEPNILPCNLEELYFGKYFDSEIGLNVLPSTLKKLVFGKFYSGPIPDDIPASLTYLQVGKHYGYMSALENLPSSIEVDFDY